MRNVLPFAITAVLLLSGCGGPPKHLETIVSVSEDFIDAADPVVAERLEQAIEDTEGLSQDLREARLAPHLVVADVLIRADQAARSARLALDTWEDSTRTEGIRLVSCLVVRMAELVDLLDEFGVPIPEELTNATSMAGSFLGHSCGGN